MSKTLYLLRHGSTGLGGRFAGSSDVPVAPECYRQLEISKEKLEGVGIAKIFCSPKLRCRQTAEYMGLTDAIIEEKDLQEIDFGNWELKTFQEIVEGWPEEVTSWSSCAENFTFPGGENTRDFIARIARVRKLIDTCCEENILVISHGGVIRHLICLYLGLSPHNYLLFNIEAGKYSTLTLHSEGGVLTSLNSG